MLNSSNHLYGTSIDDHWNNIRDAILKAAAKHIKKYKHTKRKPIIAPYTKLANQTIQISQLLNLCKRSIKENNHTSHHSHIQKIYNKIKLQDQSFPQIPNNTDNPAHNHAYLEWKEHIIQMLSANKTAHKISIQSQKTADIQQYTKMRYEMLANNKKNMIKNILDRPQKTIILNKLITLNPEPKILSEPNDILTATKHHFEQWTKKRQTLDLEDFPH